LLHSRCIWSGRAARPCPVTGHHINCTRTRQTQSQPDMWRDFLKDGLTEGNASLLSSERLLTGMLKAVAISRFLAQTIPQSLFGPLDFPLSNSAATAIPTPQSRIKLLLLLIHSAAMASKLQPRGPSSRTPSKRPKLMRASATCPQLATSNASRNDLANRQSCGAASILTRVASYSGARRDAALSTSPSSTFSSPETRSPGSANSDTRKEPFEVVIQRCK
jgi:hypothetical protein